MIKNNFDIDIDFGNREAALGHLQGITASMSKDGKLIKHNTGVYFTNIPHTAGLAGIDYKTAEERGYFKLDFLNVHVYSHVKSEEHLVELMTTPPNWALLQDREFCSKVIHIGNHYGTIMEMPEPVDNIPRLAMLLAIIRPGKKHLIGKKWKDVAVDVWTRSDEGYSFRKSHACAYAQLVVVHMNLLSKEMES